MSFENTNIPGKIQGVFKCIGSTDDYGRVPDCNEIVFWQEI